jgi:hypothetical protein
MRPGEAGLPLSEGEGAQGPLAILALGLVSGTSCQPLLTLGRVSGTSCYLLAIGRVQGTSCYVSSGHRESPRDLLLSLGLKRVSETSCYLRVLG